MDIIPQFVANESSVAEPHKGLASDEALLDSYSQAVVSAAERVGPAVAHLEIARTLAARSSIPQNGSGSGFAFTPDGLSHQQPRGSRRACDSRQLPGRYEL